MEVVVPVQDFHFDSTPTSPYVSAASSPNRSGNHPFDYDCHYTSAPTSPTRAAAAAAAFHWEENPGTPNSQIDADADADADDDFAFDFSGKLEKGETPPFLTTADELFEKGKIHPLKPPPSRLYYPVYDDRSSLASSPRSPNKGLLSPFHRGKRGGEEFDPFAAATVEATKDRSCRNPSSSISSCRSRKGSRSLSPMRGGGGGRGFFPNSSPPPANDSTTKSGGRSTKWKLRDLLLFRSSSEGRATGDSSKDPLRKYTMILPSSASSASLMNRGRGGEESRNSSFRSTDSSGSMRRGSGAAVSAHEIHYTSNRAAAEKRKKKTPMPYPQSLFGCLRFNPAVHSIARGFNGFSFNRGRS